MNAGEIIVTKGERMQINWRDLYAHPLPYQANSTFNRILMRLLSAIAETRIILVSGLENITPKQDPFILALNHTSRQEAILLPTLLAFHRGGKLIHFIADWNYRLIPGVNLIYKRGGVITVTHKPARPRILEVFKPLFHNPKSSMEQARLCLINKNSVGIFPEGTVNRDPKQLLHGQYGAARLSIATGVPVIPGGIRLTASGRSLEVHIGSPQLPPTGKLGRAELKDWHAHIMAGIARLSDKCWSYGSDSHAT